MLALLLLAVLTSYLPSTVGQHGHQHVATESQCSFDLDCSLNGKCVSGYCVCTRPWTGAICGTLAYKTTPALAKSLYNISDPRNTWNGPIVTGPDGQLHIFVPIYKVGTLEGPTSVMHGIAADVTGPWDWGSRPDLATEVGGQNPAFLVFNQSNKTVYSLWMGRPGIVRVADSPDGPFVEVEGFTYPGGNPAPIWHNGAFYMTNQQTRQIFTTPRLGGNWTVYATIAHPDEGNMYHIEDPFLWIDQNGYWHIINHAYRNDEYERCGNSTASAHFFSLDGKKWHWGPQPYAHTVHYDDGTHKTYATLERPNLHFDALGRITHLNVAADLVTGDEGCANRTVRSHFGHCPCDNCKWADHAGTTIIALDV